jgi:hypothetical protein
MLKSRHGVGGGWPRANHLLRYRSVSHDDLIPTGSRGTTVPLSPGGSQQSHCGHRATQEVVS